MRRRISCEENRGPGGLNSQRSLLQNELFALGYLLWCAWPGCLGIWVLPSLILVLLLV